MKVNIYEEPRYVLLSSKGRYFYMNISQAEIIRENADYCFLMPNFEWRSRVKVKASRENK